MNNIFYKYGTNLPIFLTSNIRYKKISSMFKMKKILYTLIPSILFYPFILNANETFSVEIEALTLVMEKFSRESDQLNNLANEKPSYVALKRDECNATVKISSQTGLQITTMESFEVNVCKKEVNKINESKI